MVRLGSGRKVEEYFRSTDKSNKGSDTVTEMDVRNVDGL